MNQLSDDDTMLALYEKITISILLVLIFTNSVLSAFTGYAGPLFGSIGYILVLVLCWLKKHYKAGIIGGIFGSGIHILELLFKDIKELRGVELVIILVNIIFPLLLIYFSYRAYRTSKQRKSDTT